MRHELDIVAVVAPQILESIGEVLTAGEVLLEAGEAAAKRMATRVDDARVRLMGDEPVNRSRVDARGARSVQRSAQEVEALRATVGLDS